jgi:GntR family transcriptional regulator of arabinose operon
MSKYMVLADTLKSEIIHLARQGIRQLPTEMELMQRHGVSRQTVRQALMVLHREGLIEKRQGSGTYIAAALFTSLSPHQTIALIAPFARDATFSASQQTAHTVFSDDGYQSRNFLTENRISQERRILESLLADPVDGILVQGTRTAFPNPNVDLYRQLQKKGCTILFLGAPYPELSDFPSLSTDDYSGGYLLASHLIQQGHRRIAGIFRSDDCSGHRRYLGCVSALRDHGLSLADEHFLWYDRSGPDTLLDPINPRLLQPFVQMHLPDCSGVICQDDEVACYLIQQLLRQNIRVPQQISVVAFGSSYHSSTSPVRITTVIPGTINLWNHAALSLLQLIKGQTISTLPFAWSLLKRDSDAPISH